MLLRLSICGTLFILFSFFFFLQLKPILDNRSLFLTMLIFSNVFLFWSKLAKVCLYMMIKYWIELGLFEKIDFELNIRQKKIWNNLEWIYWKAKIFLETNIIWKYYFVDKCALIFIIHYNEMQWASKIFYFFLFYFLMENKLNFFLYVMLYVIFSLVQIFE